MKKKIKKLVGMLETGIQTHAFDFYRHSAVFFINSLWLVKGCILCWKVDAFKAS